MDDVRVCKRCRKLFNFYRFDYCRACEDDLEEIFQKVRDYIYDHPRENLPEVAKGSEVKEADILYLLKQGRLSFDSPAGSGLLCEQCGANIASGTICERCRDSFASKFSEMASRDDATKPKSRESSPRQTRQGFTSLNEIVKR